MARRVHEYVTRGQQQVLCSTCTTCTCTTSCTSTCTPGAELGADPASGRLARQHRAQAGGHGAQEVLRYPRLWWVMHHLQPRPHLPRVNFLQEAPAPAPAGDPGREHGFKVRRAGREGLAPRAEARPEAGHGGAGHPSEGRRLNFSH